jgi:hypothetical protein
MDLAVLSFWLLVVSESKKSQSRLLFFVREIPGRQREIL